MIMHDAISSFALVNVNRRVEGKGEGRIWCGSED
jgi:hypothetical protein